MTRVRMIVVGSVLCLLALAGISAQAQSFSDPVTYTLVSENPGRAATGDLDGDGERDIAIPTYAPGSPGYVEVLLNLGDGNLGGPTEYGVGNYPESVAAADLDGDFDLDLAVANRGDGTVSVLTNRGDGTFEAAVDHAAGSSPSVVVAGDLNGDGLADLAVASSYEVSWLANNGDGTFAAPQSYSFQNFVVDLKIGEMEADTDLDLVVLERGSSSSTLEAWVTGLWNDGSGNFGYSPRYLGGSWGDGWDYAIHPSVDSLALGDLNGNGYLDVLIGANTGLRWLPHNGNPLGRVNVLENVGDGYLMSGQSRGSCHDESPWLDTGDLDSDGDLDVVTGWVYFLNDGTGHFGDRQNHGGGGDHVTVDDLHLDGLPDLVLPVGPDRLNLVLNVDLCPDDPNKIEPGDCGCGQPDEPDTDGDGVADCIDQCPGEPDTDTDGDGVANCVDLCPDDPGKADPGVCGCGIADVDSDGDEVLDCFDPCPDDPGKVDPGVCGCGVADVDSDEDGFLDCVDSCPGFDDARDCNGNLVPDGCDLQGDRFQRERKLIASNGAEADWFGNEVSIHGDTIVVGARGDDDLGTDSGSAYVYRYDAVSGLWAEEQQLTASDGAEQDWFGIAVSVHGDTIVVGASHDDDAGPMSGAAYIYRYDEENGVWGEEQKLVGSGGYYLGAAVSVDGDTIVVGTAGYDTPAYVYRFDQENGLWVEEQQLTASDGAAGDDFGEAVSIDGDTIAVGAHSDDDLGTNSGAVYVYRYDEANGLWVEEQKLTASDGAGNVWYGAEVAVHGDTIVVGAYGDDDLGPGSGSSYVYRYDEENGLWVEEQKLTASDGADGDNFGGDVSVNGDTIAVVTMRNDDLGEDSGSAYVYRYDEENDLWVEEQKLTASDGAGGDWFGYSVSIQGDTIVVGASRGDGLDADSGAVYTYARSATSSDCNVNGVPDECETDGGSFAYDGTLTASDGATDDHFGANVSMDGDIFVVGAYLDDAMGADSGSVYVYRYAPFAGLWVEEDKLTASDGAEGDNFGRFLSLHDDTIAVGVWGDDDPVMGIDSGSVYVYRHDEENGLWVEEQKLLALDGAADDQFGEDVSIHGDTLAVGAWKDDDLGNDSGSVYVYRYDTENRVWNFEQKLTASDGAADDHFGRRVALGDDRLVVGAHGDADAGVYTGSAYVFRYDDESGAWVEEDKVTASAGAAWDHFGSGVAIQGDTIVVGAFGDVTHGFDTGAAYVYRHDEVSGLWVEKQKLTATAGAAYDRFGENLSIDGHTIAVGSHWDDDPDLGSDSGSAYVYRYDAESDLWDEDQKLTAPDGAAGDEFGWGVAVDNGTIVVGAHGRDDLGAASGAVYTFERPGTVSDCDRDGVPDECQPDSDLDGLIDGCDCAPDNWYCSTDCTDTDVDGFCVTSDCDDVSPDNWGTPGEVTGVRFDLGTKDEFSWDAPAEPGAALPRYDTLRSEFAGDFGEATCIESDDPSVRRAADLTVPDPGIAFHYLVRAENDCPDGQGTLGHDSSGLERTGNVCP